LVAVDGRLQVRPWVAQDGTKRRSVEVVAYDIRSLERPRDQQSGSPYNEAPHPSEHAPAGRAPAEEADADFNDPFADE